MLLGEIGSFFLSFPSIPPSLLSYHPFHPSPTSAAARADTIAIGWRTLFRYELRLKRGRYGADGICRSVVPRTGNRNSRLSCFSVHAVLTRRKKKNEGNGLGGGRLSFPHPLNPSLLSLPFFCRKSKPTFQKQSFPPPTRPSPPRQSP